MKRSTLHLNEKQLATIKASLMYFKEQPDAAEIIDMICDEQNILKFQADPKDHQLCEELECQECCAHSDVDPWKVVWIVASLTMK